MDATLFYFDSRNSIFLNTKLLTCYEIKHFLMKVIFYSFTNFCEKCTKSTFAKAERSVSFVSCLIKYSLYLSTNKKANYDR